MRNKDKKRNPSNLLKGRLETHKKTMGILRKMKIHRNPPKLQVTQPYPTSRIWN
jgi:hypothetical protein